MLPRVSSFHNVWGEIAIWINGLIGLWGVVMYRARSVPRVFYWGVGAAICSMLLQVVVGVVVMEVDDVAPGQQHVFYGVVIAATFAFAYIYRAQLRKRPSLYLGLLLLFTMGLGIRGIMTYGLDF